MSRRRRRHWDEDELEERIEDAIEEGARTLEIGGRKIAERLSQLGTTVTITSDGKTEKITHTPAQAIVVPPPTAAEQRDRLISSVFDSGSLWVFGGMVIGAFATGMDGMLSYGLLAGGLVFYIAGAAEAYTKWEYKRERRLKKKIKAGEMPSYVPVEVPHTVYATGEAPLQTHYERLVTLADQIKSKIREPYPLVQPVELDRALAIAADYQKKHGEVAAYLHGIGGVEKVQTEVINLRTQLEEMRPDDNRRASVEKLLGIKEQTARNLAAMQQFLQTVDIRLQEQIAQMESLEAALMRHELGSFQRSQKTEEAIGVEDFSSITTGLSQTADDMEHELLDLDRELA